LGIGVLPRALDKILPDYEQIDVVEIDPDMVGIAKEYFFFQSNDKLKVHIKDGFEFVMSLNEAQTYDLIIMDAFENGYCAPDVFLNSKYVSKLKEQLTSSGIISLNTLPQCVKHEQELSLYETVFDNYYISETISSNKIFLGLKGKTPQMKQIKRNANLLQDSFTSLDINTKWITEVFHFNKKRYYGVCDNYFFFKEILFFYQ
jgi:spermidine synthase